MPYSKYKNPYILLAATLFSGFLLCALLFARVDPAKVVSAAQQSNDQCHGLDVVFLIDQSGSMGTQKGKGNDPDLIRGDAVKQMIGILGNNSLYQCPGTIHRLAVLGFGSTVVPYIDEATIAPRVDQFAEWKIQREPLYQKIKDSENLKGTDHALAMESAVEILNRWVDNPIGTDSRKRAIVLITDGGPCTETCPTDKDKYKEYAKEYLDDMENTFNADGNVLPFPGDGNSRSIWLFIIAMRGLNNDQTKTTTTTGPTLTPTPSNAPDYLANAELKSAWERLAQNHGGKLKILPLENQNAFLGTFAAEIMNELLGSKYVSVPCRQPIWIDPYLSDVTIVNFFIHGASPGNRLEDVNVTIHAMRGLEEVAVYSGTVTLKGQPKVHDFEADGPNKRYVFLNPLPGRYEIRVSGANQCDVDVQQGKTNAQFTLASPETDAVLPQVNNAPFYDLDNPTYFKFQATQEVADAKRKPLEEDPDFPITMVLTTTSSSPSGPVTETYALKRVQDGEYQSEKPITTQYPGTVTWEVTATAPNPRRDAAQPVNDPIVVYKDKGSFTVKAVERFSYKITAPTSGSELALNTVSGTKLLLVPITVSAQLLDQNLAQGDPRQILQGDLNAAFVADLLDLNGNLLEKDVPLHPVNGKLGFFTAQLGTNPSSPGGVYQEGDYEIQVRFEGQVDSLNYAPGTRRESVRFSGVTAKPVDAVLVAPGTSVLHKELGGCLGGEVNPFPVTVTLYVADAQGNKKQVNVQDLLTSTDKLQLMLYDSTNLTETVTLKPFSSAGGTILKGEVGGRLDSAGAYKLVLQLPNDALKSRYSWVTPEKTVNLTREDSLVTNPLACRGAAGTGVLLAVALLGFLIFIFTGGPTGIIRIIDANDQTMVASLHLSQWQRWNNTGNRKLKDIGVKQVKIWKTDPIGPRDPESPPIRAVQVEATDINGSKFFGPQTLETNMGALPFVQGYDIEYQ